MRTWFITGTSRGLGRHYAEAALARGDRVVATARDTSALDDLVAEYADRVVALKLDVSDSSAAQAAVDEGVDRFGHIDVLVNNAGYGLFGALEEVTEEQARALLDTNLFGSLWVTKAVLPSMRAQGAGRIIQISSFGGVGTVPTLGVYHASKWGIEALLQTLHAEVAPLGIKVTIVEPGPYPTEWGTSSAVHAAPIPAYDHLRKALQAAGASAVPGDPRTAAQALLKVADADEPPLRVFFGLGGLDFARAQFDQRLTDWTSWQWLTEEAVGPSALASSRPGD